MLTLYKLRYMFTRGLLIVLILMILPVANVLGREQTTNTVFDIYLPLVIGPDPWAAVDPSGQNIIFWHNHSVGREIVLQEIVDEFNTTNPWGITVTPQYQGGYNDIYNKMMAAIAIGGGTPDLVVAYQNHMADYQQSAALVDMTGLVEGPTWGLSASDKADYFPGIYNHDIFSTYNNARLGFPPQPINGGDVLQYGLVDRTGL